MVWVGLISIASSGFARCYDGYGWLVGRAFEPALALIQGSSLTFAGLEYGARGTPCRAMQTLYCTIDILFCWIASPT